MKETSRGVNHTSLTTEEGYTLLSDTTLLQRLAQLGREHTPERIVHAKGTGAYGYFEVTNDLTEYTKANFLSQVGKQTEVFVRFSTANGEKGTADTVRDPRGFAVKFYTEEGEYDLVGSSFPVFYIQDAMQYPDLMHAQKRHPKTQLRDANLFWDFVSQTPESLYQVMWLFTDFGTPDGYRYLNGFGVHTFMWYNPYNEYVWIKYHLITDQGIKNLTVFEAEELAGKDADYAVRDLHNAIESGDYPSWSVYVQIMSPDETSHYKVNPFDATKTWDEEDYPLIPLGKLVLNRNPEDYISEVERVTFAPSQFVPGIWASPDKLLQGRLFAYEDAQRHRLGAHYKESPTNRVQDTLPPLHILGTIKRHTIEASASDFMQPGAFYREQLNREEKAHLIYNIAAHLGKAHQMIQYRQVVLFRKADSDMGTLLAQLLGLDLEKLNRLELLSEADRLRETQV